MANTKPKSSQVTYQPAGVGAVAGTVESKLHSLELSDYASLRAFTENETHVQIVASGIAGLFKYDSADTTSADNGGTVIVGADGRRWRRVFDGAVSVKWFGAKGDYNPETGIGTNDSPSFIAAIAAHRNVHAPESVYLISDLKLNRNYITLTGDGIYATRFYAAPLPVPVISIATKSVSSASFVTLRDFSIHGNETCIGGIKLGTATTTAPGPVVSNVFITGFTNAADGAGYGIQMGSTQNADFENVWVTYNRINYHRPIGGYGTSTRIHGKRSYIGHSSHRGILIDGQIDDIYIEDAVVEGNASLAVEVTSTAISGARGTRVWFKKLYFEANLNGGVGDSVIKISGGLAPYQDHRFSVDSCNFASDPNAPAGYKRLNVNRSIGRVADTLLPPLDIATSANCSMRFEFNKMATASNYLTGYRALLGNIIVTDFVDPFSSSDLNQVNLLNAITFPATNRPVSDPNTLDDYRERTWVPVASGISGSITSITGEFTKIGRIVNFNIVIQGTSLASTGTAQITLPTTISRLGNCTVLGITPNQLIGFGYVNNDVVTLPAFSAISSALISINGSYTTNV